MRRRRRSSEIQSTRVFEIKELRRVTRLAERVHRRARELGIELREVARRCGLKKSSLSHKLVRPAMRADVLDRLTRALEMAPEDWDAPLLPLGPDALTLAARLRKAAEARAKRIQAALDGGTRARQVRDRIGGGASRRREGKER